MSLLLALQAAPADVKVSWIEIDTAVTTADVKISWIAFDTASAIVDVMVSWIQFDTAANDGIVSEWLIRSRRRGRR